MGTFIYIVAVGLLRFLEFSIFAAAIFSWLVAFQVINYHNEFVRQLGRFLEAVSRPVLRPIQKILPAFGSVDLSPLVAILIIEGLIRASSR